MAVRQIFPAPIFGMLLRAAMLYLSNMLALFFFVKAPPVYAQQITRVPPFIGTHSETWERFGVTHIFSGTSILGGIATISGDHMVTEGSFQLCTVVGVPSDGNVLMELPASLAMAKRALLWMD